MQPVAAAPAETTPAAQTPATASSGSSSPAASAMAASSTVAAGKSTGAATSPAEPTPAAAAPAAAAAAAPPSSAVLSAVRDGEKITIKDLPIATVLDRLQTSEQGLTDEEAARRLEQFGLNQLPETYHNPFLIFLSFLWNPLSWAMEAAAIISIALVDYADFILIVGLLLINATIGYYEDQNAGNAVAALKSQLAPQSKVLRSGEFKSIPAAKLVPGDIIRIRIGDVIPADVKLLHGDPLKVDQASLTGESLPATKVSGDEAYSGSIVKQGEIECVVHATGSNTFFGKAAALIDEAEKSGHLQEVLSQVGYLCLGSIFLWVIIELIVQFGVRNSPTAVENLIPVGVSLGSYVNLWGPDECTGGADGCPTLTNVVVLIVGGIPIAMPTVLSVTMAIGALRLSKRQAIVSRLTAVEELAGMDILCSDKTGTLTLNKLSIDKKALFPVGEFTTNDILFDGSLASRTEDEDPIDTAIVNSLEDALMEELSDYTVLHFTPFDPVSKRTVAKVRDKEGNVFRVAKGAPQVILKMAFNAEELQPVVRAKIDEFASRGYRALGIGRSNSGDVPLEECDWEMVGLLPLYDPPRHDTAETIKSAISMGIAVKMITGDQLAIARETARQLGMSTDIYNTEFLEKGVMSPDLMIPADELVEKADGFAEVFPQHKFEIVRKLQERKHTVGMTGDGVNDAPALKQSDIGIAVAGATDAARAAADIVLLTPGLSVIIDAIVGARKIFQRMKNYATYSIAMTVRVTFTFGLLTTIYNFYFPTILIVILAILNDGTMLTISKDRVKPSPLPDQWRVRYMFLLSFIYGLYLMASTLVLFAIASNPNSLFVQLGAPVLNLATYEGQARLRGLVYMQVSISGQALIFVTRSRGFSYLERPHVLVIVSFVVAQLVATFIGVYGFGGYPNFIVNQAEASVGKLLWGRESFMGAGWPYAALVWIWCIIWYLPLDLIKMLFFYVTTPASKTRAHRMTLAKEVKFADPFQAARPSIVTRVSSARVLK